MDYKQTLNITLNDKDPGAMQQKASLPVREPEIQARWEEIGLYQLSIEKPAPRGPFILHDGPPYSNNNIHLGHALNKIAKDIIIKYKTMQGYCAPYIPGWDNHGMPIENEVAKEFAKKGVKPDKLTMRKRCREYAAKWVDEQKKQFQRLGVRGDWENPYLTMDSKFEAAIVDTFGKLAEAGYIYRGLKPVMWSPASETALADAEIEYEPHTSNSIYVRFPIATDPAGVFSGRTAYAVIWTTTPWTIPANMALAVHPEARYIIVTVGDADYLVAEPLLGKALRTIYPPINADEHVHHESAGDNESYSYESANCTVTAIVRRRLVGSELEGVVARHPIFDRPSPIVFADYVTMEDGTGIVHTAPGHGKEDFETGMRYGLDILCPVDTRGILTLQAGEEFAGAKILGGGADARVIEKLTEVGNLLKHLPFEHSYPHDWRTHTPLIFRATVQWFMNIDHESHRERSLDAIRETRWYPPVSINRISSMVSGRPDWCLSRQRAWGVGIPAFYCKDCGAEIISRDAVNAVRDVVAERSSDAWYDLSAEEILPANFVCPNCASRNFEKETDILDVWFDSGSTHHAVLLSGKWDKMNFPADVYLEGSDQHRGWFNSSLMIGVGTEGCAPYKSVVTNGFTVDDKGRKMSKSYGNVVPPEQVISKYGADVLRLWVASSNYFEEVRCSDDIVERVATTYRQIRNTFRFLVNNLYDFDPAADAIPDEELQELDQWALGQLDRVVGACTEGYDNYEFHRVYHAVHNFCEVELSALYLDVIKDRLYCSGKRWPERRSAQTVLHRLAETLARLLAPILSHTAEEVWNLLTMADKAPSVQLTDFPVANPAQHQALLTRWEPLLGLRDPVNQAMEHARQQGVVKKSLDARVTIAAPESLHAQISGYAYLLPTVLKTSQAELVNAGSGELSVEVIPAPGARCARSWLTLLDDVGSDPDYPDLSSRDARAVRELGL